MSIDSLTLEAFRRAMARRSFLKASVGAAALGSLFTADGFGGVGANQIRRERVHPVRDRFDSGAAHDGDSLK